MFIKAIALDSFAHGSQKYAAGDPVEATPGDMADLVKAGLVSAPKTATDSKPAEDDLDDLVGGKAEAAPQNKMEPAPANKGAAPKPKK